MIIFALGPIVALGILATLSVLLFLGGLLSIKPDTRSPIFGAVWTIVTLIPVYVGIPVLFFLR